MGRLPISPLRLGLVFALALLVVLLFRMRESDPPSVEPSPVVGHLFPIEKVREISFRRGNSFVRVVREGDGFWIAEPYRDRAAEEMIAQSLNVAATLQPLRILPDTSGAAFGLTSPSAVWNCRWDGGEYRIAIGDSIPAGGGRYARRTGSPQVLVVDPFLVRRFLAPPVQDVHSMVACPVGVGPIDSIRVETREERLVIVRRRADLWEIVSPIHAEAAAPEISRAVQNLRNATMTQVLGPTAGLDLPSLGLEPPRAVWTLYQGTVRSTSRIGHPTPDERSVHVVPAGRDVVGLIASESFRIWVDGTVLLRESRMLRVDPDSVEWVSVRDGAAGREFAKLRDGGWRETTRAETLDVRQDAFGQALANLSGLRAVSFSPGNELGEAPSTLRFRLRSTGGRIDSLELGEPAGPTGAATGSRQPGACQVSAAAYRTWRLWLGRPLRP